MPAFSVSCLELDQCQVDVRRGGKGPPLLFLHGGGGAVEWGAFHDRLSSRFEVIAPTHPGYDGSDDPPWLDRVADLACFYLDFLKALDLAGVHIVGHSLGGWITAELATRDTHRLSTCTLMCAAGIHVAGVAQLDTFVLSPEERTRRIYHDKSKAEAIIERMASLPIDQSLKNAETTARLAWQPRLYDPHLRKWLHRIDRPVLALWGASDPIFPPIYAETWAGLIPGAKAVVLPECGHSPNVEQPQAAADAIINFIDRAVRA